MEKEYKKSYKLFIIWMIALIVIPVIQILICDNYFDLSSKVVLLCVDLEIVLFLDILLYIIYKGEYIYWFTGGPSYEEAKVAGGKARKAYAKAHLDIFIKYSIIILLASIISYLLKWSIAIDITIITLGMVIAAIRTMPIKFKNYIEKD